MIYTRSDMWNVSLHPVSRRVTYTLVQYLLFLLFTGTAIISLLKILWEKTLVSQFLTLSKSNHISVDIMTTPPPTYASYTARNKTHLVMSRTARSRVSKTSGPDGWTKCECGFRGRDNGTLLYVLRPSGRGKSTKFSGAKRDSWDETIQSAVCLR